MSFVIMTPEPLTSGAADLEHLGATINSAHAAATAPTTGILDAGADELSAAVSSLLPVRGGLSDAQRPRGLVSAAVRWAA